MHQLSHSHPSRVASQQPWGLCPRHLAARQLEAPLEDAPSSTDWELASCNGHSEGHHLLPPPQLCRPLPGCPLLLPKSQDINPTSPKSFRAVCPPPCLRGLAKMELSLGLRTPSVGAAGAPRLNGLTCWATCFHRLNLKPCLGCQAKHGLLALTGFTATMDPASPGMGWDLARQH